MEREPNGIAPGVPGAKFDGDKPPILRGAIQYFPRAWKTIAAISARGAKKYSWKGWEKVEDGENRYGDAMMRHILAEETEGLYDTGPHGIGALHAGQVAWNALARLELMLRRLEKEDVETGSNP